MNVLLPLTCQILQSSVTKSISKSLLLARPDSTSKCGKGLKEMQWKHWKAEQTCQRASILPLDHSPTPSPTSLLTKELLADGPLQGRIPAAPSSVQAPMACPGGGGKDKSSQKNSSMTSGTISGLLSQSRGYKWTNGQEAR